MIPESLSDKADLLPILITLDLPANFDLFSYDNLIPAHGHCNLVKGSRVFSSQSARFYLERARAASDNVRKMLESKRTQGRRDDLLGTIDYAIHSGIITADDLQLNQRRNTLRLSKPLFFADTPDKPVLTISQSEVEGLLDRPVLINGDPNQWVTFRKDSRARMTVRTCREYRAALAAEFGPQSNLDNKMSTDLKIANSVLLTASSLRAAYVSYIQNPYRGVPDLDLMPATLLSSANSEDEHLLAIRNDDLSLQQLLSRAEVKIIRISSSELSLEWRYWGFMIRELCRADIDGDGVEDILCERYDWATQGTYGYGSTCILTRTNENGRFKVSHS